MSLKTLPAYMRLPDGVRVSGSASIDDTGTLVFVPKQALSTVPPSGLPIDVVVAGLPDDAEGQVRILGSVESSGPRSVVLEADDPIPNQLVAYLAPNGGSDAVGAELSTDTNPREMPDGPYVAMTEQGIDRMGKSMRRFLVDLGDHLFDLATSAQYGSAGRHRHYDALNQLKRTSSEVTKSFQDELAKSLKKQEKDSDEEVLADLASASAGSLDLVGLDEIDQQLASDKIINFVLDKHRVALECLTIRAALVNNIEPPKATTPFHPAYVLKAFMSSLNEITEDADVTNDIIRFFGQKFTNELAKLYPVLNDTLIFAGVEPDLEQEVMAAGSLLNPPPEKRIVKSRDIDTKSREDKSSREADTTNPPGRTDRGQASTQSSSAPTRAPGGKHSSQDTMNAGDGNQPDAEPVPQQKHDAMYDAVLAALDGQRTRGASGASGAQGRSASSGQSTDKSPSVGGSATDVGTPTPDTPELTLGHDEILSTLKAMQGAQPESASLASLSPLSSLITTGQDEQGQPVELERDSANRLNFIDNVFRTLHQNFEVSAEMEPSVARLRVPMARLALQEPRFFTQPEHPAHRLLDKLSTLASADHTVSRNLRKKVEDIVERVATDYEDDSAVFDTAQRELDVLVGEKDRVLGRNMERVVSALKGQERLTRVQRGVERTLDEHLDSEATPTAVQNLLDGGWRSSMVQVALREGTDSAPWLEEVALLDALLSDIKRAARGELPDREKRDMEFRLGALQKRLDTLNPGAVAHASALKTTTALLGGNAELQTQAYAAPAELDSAPASERVEQLPRLRRWLQRARELEPVTKLRYRDKEGKQRQMRLVWVSDDRNRFAFVNERGQKIAELSAVQLARQLSRGAQPPTSLDQMSVLDQSMYNTLEDAQRTLSFERNRDQLTRLINGDSLLRQLQRTVRHARNRSTEHAFLLLDIDNFALVNEVFDATSGDEVLVEFAKLLGQLNDNRALTARIDEDEFGILLTYRSAEEAREVAEKIRKDITASSLHVAGEPVSFTASMGIAPIQQTSKSGESIMQNARSALALAKAQGKDQVVVYNPDQQEMADYGRDREASRRSLDEAMSTDRLVLRAQPIAQTAIDGSERAKHHYEILLALRDDEGNLGSPQDFISSAERFGFITLVDRWVVREVFSWISSLVDKQKVVPQLSINLSGTSLTDNDFLDYILEQISEFGVGTSRLCFEITETGAIDNLPRAADFVRTLKNIGCKFSLDDFGTGLASHNYLRELPVDYVKIDGTFISNIHLDRTDYAMAKSIHDLAHFLGQQTVAECVESLDSLPALREIGIDFLQGWGIGMPAVLDEIAEELPNLET